MGFVRENYQGEMPGHALPISKWAWLGSRHVQKACGLANLGGHTSGPCGPGPLLCLSTFIGMCRSM